MPNLKKCDVSIHAPAQGATQSDCNLYWHSAFQSTRPHRARQVQKEPHSPKRQFQSTRPHRARQRRQDNRSVGECFNPRARTGRDLLEHTIQISPIKFQSTRPHRARLKKEVNAYAVFGFQSTRPHRARRRQSRSNLPPANVSIHAPAQGAT